LNKVNFNFQTSHQYQENIFILKGWSSISMENISTTGYNWSIKESATECIIRIW
jgi:hypothetical protein